jgi:hypothetical protein
MDTLFCQCGKIQFGVSVICHVEKRISIDFCLRCFNCGRYRTIFSLEEEEIWKLNSDEGILNEIQDKISGVTDIYPNISKELIVNGIANFVKICKMRI